MNNDDSERLALWLCDNHHRPTWEVITLIGKGWPNATAWEVCLAWFRMQEIVMESFHKTLGERPPKLDLIDDEPDGEAD